MALPPRGHPDRPLRLAARSMMTLGVVLLIFSTCAGIGLIASFVGGVRQAASFVVTIAFYLGPGVGFVICSVHLKRYRAWAAIVGLVLAGLGLLGSLLLLVGFLALAVAGAEADEDLLWLVLLLLIPVLFVAAFTQLIIHLSKSFKAIRIHEMQGPQGHGFVPIMGATTSPAPTPSTAPSTATPTAGSGSSAPH